MKALIRLSKAHVLGPLYFISWIEANYRPSTHQELHYLKFDLTNYVQEKKLLKLQNKCDKVSWGGKMTATQSSTISLSVKRSKEYFFTLFHHVFWKRPIFEGAPVLELLELLVPKVHWGQENMWKKFRKFLKKFDDFWRNFVKLLFQICLLQPKHF